MQPKRQSTFGRSAAETSDKCRQTGRHKATGKHQAEVVPFNKLFLLNGRMILTWGK